MGGNLLRAVWAGGEDMWSMPVGLWTQQYVTEHPGVKTEDRPYTAPDGSSSLQSAFQEKWAEFRKTKVDRGLAPASSVTFSLLSNCHQAALVSQERSRTYSLVPLSTSSLSTLGVFILCESEGREGSLLCACVFFAGVCSRQESEIRPRRWRAAERALAPTLSDLSSCSFLGKGNQVNYWDASSVRTGNMCPWPDTIESSAWLPEDTPSFKGSTDYHFQFCCNVSEESPIERKGQSFLLSTIKLCSPKG